jgi:hypothetical protein
MLCRNLNPGKISVLYLADKNDLDRSVALSKGFKNENLIAVNWNEEICRSIRASGNPAICGDLSAIVYAWDYTIHPPLGVIVADLMCGLNARAMEFLGACLSLSLPLWPCISVNLLRGRDAESNQHRALCNEKNRAMAFIVGLRDSLIEALRIMYADQVFTETDLVYTAVQGISPLQFRSYKSTTGVVMDSCVFTMPRIVRLVTLKERIEFPIGAGRFGDRQAKTYIQWPGDVIAARRKLSAYKAMKSTGVFGNTCGGVVH